MWIARPFASLAQLVEHVICNLGVVGSSPTRGSLTRLVLETTSTVDEQIAKLSSLLVFFVLRSTDLRETVAERRIAMLLSGFGSGHIWRNSTSSCYNNLEPATYRNGTVSGKSDFHVDISKYPGGEFLFST